MCKVGSTFYDEKYKSKDIEVFMVVKIPNLTVSFQGHPNTRKNEIRLKITREKETRLKIIQ